MDLNWLFLIGIVIALAACIALGWQRRRVARLQVRLEASEHSRLELAEETLILRERLDALTAPDEDMPARRAALERLLERELDAATAWSDTEPMSVPPDSRSFAPTQPATITGGR